MRSLPLKLHVGSKRVVLVAMYSGGGGGIGRYVPRVWGGGGLAGVILSWTAFLLKMTQN